MNPNARLARLTGGADLALALAALGVVALLFAPIPPALLDVAIAANLGLSATILVVTLLARDAPSFATFPTLLLLTTLFRLALAVSSTRLVLARGDAGRVIEALGRVVVQGTPVVGVVVFAILALVQILVVAKGAERVAEVAARFSLDALPGKQMAIDADLRAGAIDQAEARRRRRALERESQLHGAMDGALKFVKGDAFAGIAIVLVNLAGGAAAGVARGLSVGEAAERYALLAIGDGLASQIPALLLAIAAGVAVTRVAAEQEGAPLGEELRGQLLRDPRAPLAAAGLLALLAVAPGIPAAPFLLLSTVAGAAGVHALRRRRSSASAGGDGAPAAETLPEPCWDEPSFEAELSEDLLALVARAPDGVRALGGALAEAALRQRGVPLEGVRVRAGALPPGTWRLNCEGIPAAGGALDPEEVLSLAPADDLALVAIPARPAIEPEGGGAAALLAAADAERARALGPVLEAPARLRATLAAALCREVHRTFGVQELQTLLERLEPGAPALVREVARAVPAATLAEALRRLLEEQISLRPLRPILEAALEPGAPVSAAALAERCRRALARHIVHGCAPSGPLPALVLDPAAELRLREAVAGEVLALEPELSRELLAALACGLEAADGAAPVVLTTAEVRRPLRQLIRSTFPEVRVLSYEELPPDASVRPLGRLALAA